MKIIVRSIVVGLVAVGLSACGGGGGGSAKKDSGADNSGVVGYAIKGAINGGIVSCLKADGSVQETTTTNADGVYKLKKPCPASGKLVVSGGIDKATGEEVEKLSASGDSTYITPLTTMQRVVKDNNIEFSNSAKTRNNTFLAKSNNTNPTDNSSSEAKKLVKASLILHNMAKSLQQQTMEDLSYDEAMGLISEQLKGAYIDVLGSDDAKTDAKAMVGKVLGKTTNALAKKMQITIPQDNIDKIKAIIDDSNTSLQSNDNKKDGLKDKIPASLRSGLSRGYVKITSEKIDGSNYTLQFTKSNPHSKNKTGLSYKCKVFSSGSVASYRTLSWSGGTITCNINTDFTTAVGNKNSYLVIQYSKDGKTNYSAPHKIGSLADSGTNRQLKFTDGKIYLPKSDTWTEFDVTATSVVPTSFRVAGYLPKGFYYKVASAPTAKFKNTVFGVKLAIGFKDIIMMANRLYIQDNAISSRHSNNSNPYLHGTDSTSGWSLRKSFYHYYNADGVYTRKNLSGLNRVDFNTKSGYLRFKLPSESDDKLKLNIQTALSGDIVGVSLSDLCNVEIGLGSATMCDLIRSTINAENATQVTITPFIKASQDKRSGGIKGKNIFTTNQAVTTIRGESDFATFPAVVIAKPSGYSFGGDKTDFKTVDSDSDGVSDYWEMKLGRDPFGADSNTDKDNDGLADKDEIKLGLNPADSADKISFVVSSNELNIRKGGIDKTFTVSLTGGAGKVSKFINLSLLGKAGNAVSLSPAHDKDISMAETAKTITVTPEDTNTFNDIDNPRIEITGKLKKGSVSVTLPIKQVAIQSDDFKSPLKPDSIALSYKSEGNALTVNGSNLLVGVVIEASPTPSTDLPAGAVANYRWENSDNGSNWDIIASASSKTYTIQVSDQGKFIRSSVVYNEAGKEINWSVKRSQIVVNAAGDMVQVRPSTPTTPPTISTPTNYHLGSIITISATDSKGFSKSYQWQSLASTTGAVWSKISGAKSQSYTIPVRIENLGTKYKGCYAYTKNRKTSNYLCSAEATVTKGKYKTPAETKTSTTTAPWGTNITFTKIAGQQYRLVKTDGTANDNSTGVTIATTTTTGTIRAVKPGVVKLQTRLSETPTHKTSSWSSGATITFTKKPTTTETSTSLVLSATSATVGTPITFSGTTGQEYQLLLLNADGSTVTNRSSSGIRMTKAGDNYTIDASKSGKVKLRTRVVELPKYFASDWVVLATTIKFSKDTQKITASNMIGGLLGIDATPVRAKTTGDGTISYAISPLSTITATVATSTGVIDGESPSGAGVVTIRITASETGKYDKATKDITVAYDFIKEGTTVATKQLALYSKDADGGGSIGEKWDKANNTCNDLNRYGKTDWSLPNKEQVKLITDNNRKIRYFDKIRGTSEKVFDFNAGHWTRTTVPSDTNKKYVYYSDYDLYKSTPKTHQKRFFCVAEE